jgi:hypothetical protein
MGGIEGAVWLARGGALGLAIGGLAGFQGEAELNDTETT